MTGNRVLDEQNSGKDLPSLKKGFDSKKLNKLIRNSENASQNGKHPLTTSLDNHSKTCVASAEFSLMDEHEESLWLERLDSSLFEPGGEEIFLWSLSKK